MLPYWFLFCISAWFALTETQSQIRPGSRWTGSWLVMFVLLVFMVGFRHEVGGDWYNYKVNLDYVSILSFQEALSIGDPAYQFLSWLFCNSSIGSYLINAVCAVFFSWGFVAFCRAQPNPWLALVVGVPYLVTVVAMGYTRQGTAIGLAMLGLVALAERSTLRFVIFVILAALFHKSAVILLPLAAVAGTKSKIWTATWVGGSVVLFYVLLLQDSVEGLKTGYLDARYQSEGAAIRIAMNAAPAVIFLLFRRKFVMSYEQLVFWTWMSLGALAFVVMLKVSPSSTAVDRVALYWIPLQIFILSRLPGALGKHNGLHGALSKLIMIYCAAVLFVWLNFAQMAYAWLPYQFYPWVWLWQ